MSSHVFAGRGFPSSPFLRLQVCSNQGLCVTSPIACVASDVACVAACACNADWGGPACSIPAEGLGFLQVRACTHIFATMPLTGMHRLSNLAAPVVSESICHVFQQGQHAKYLAAQGVAMATLLPSTGARTATAITQQAAAVAILAAHAATMSTSALQSAASTADSIVAAAVSLAGIEGPPARDVLGALGALTAAANVDAIHSCSVDAGV